ncbi:hypothetical protein [Saccharolobus caldissimus]|uniref:Uncharacterized protein n=1 Tax=Saccharolobus caldissimus TaxID=1702097 RepID=A0AAQ4CU18_9CREN|nr:hypothetical protein [Saccharolobus caldissimus]BDB99299.1 hypothetical protein SACC_23160 [Saccharolobus caldissimus]
MKKYTIAGLLAILILIFFVILSLPLNFMTSSIIGVPNTTILMAAIYMILTAAIFILLYRGVSRV